MGVLATSNGARHGIRATRASVAPSIAPFDARAAPPVISPERGARRVPPSEKRVVLSPVRG
jgi:hypothetical protein